MSTGRVEKSFASQTRRRGSRGRHCARLPVSIEYNEARKRKSRSVEIRERWGVSVGTTRCSDPTSMSEVGSLQKQAAERWRDQHFAREIDVSP